MFKIILIKSPDEWVTTKQACRDELVVYLFFSPNNIYDRLYIRLQSVIKKNHNEKTFGYLKFVSTLTR